MYVKYQIPSPVLQDSEFFNFFLIFLLSNEDLVRYMYCKAQGAPKNNGAEKIKVYHLRRERDDSTA